MFLAVRFFFVFPWPPAPPTSIHTDYVLAEVTRSALSPLLYSQTFQDTLILVGSLAPLPEIEALSSPSQLLNLEDTRTIYPTIQPFQPSATALEQSHPLPALLQHGSLLAESYRKSNDFAAPRPTSWGSRSRRNSGASSSGTMTPPLTPQQPRKLLSPFGRRSSVASSSSPASPAGSVPGSQVDLSRLASASGGGTKRAPSVLSMSTLGNERSNRRMKTLIFGDEPRVSEGSPFDAVINFIPTPAPRADPQRVLQEMLQHTVVLSTAVLPILTTAITANSVTAATPYSELAPLSIINIVPTEAPAAFAPVVERFLLPLLPTMDQRVRRNLFGCVTGYGAWMAQDTAPGPDSMPGADTLLCGGVRNLAIFGPEGSLPQALLPGWEHCTLLPGSLTDAAQKTETPPTFSRRASSYALSELRAAQAGHPVSAPASPSVGTGHKRSGSTASATAKTLTRKFSISSIREFASSSSSGGDRTPKPTATRSATEPQLNKLTEERPAVPAVPQQTEAKAFTSRFDPRSLSTSLSQTTSSSASRLGSLGMSSRGNQTANSPSALRNQVVPTTLVTSPPTPELDPSSSSCSSSSVLEPPAEERSVNSATSANSAIRAVPAPAENTKTAVFVRKYSFASLFRRRGGGGGGIKA